MTNNLHRMEETFLRVKTERDELMKRQYRDSTDSGKSRESESTNDDIVNLKSELSRQKKAYEAQFIEYVSIFSKLKSLLRCFRVELYNLVLGCGLNYD